MLDIWKAERFDAILQSGRTRPLVIACTREISSAAAVPVGGPVSASDSRTMVIKALGLPEVTPASLFNEVFGNLLARELGIETPAPALVLLTEEFLESAAPALAESGIQLRSGLAVGSEYFHDGLASVTFDLPLTPEEQAQAARIYGYDLIVQNPDRRSSKPNCAQRDGRLIAFDFEMSFSFLLVLGQEDQPWQVSKHGIGSQHLFYSGLRSGHPDWREFLSDLDRLSDEYLDRLTEKLPDDWKHNEARVRTHLAAIRAHLSELEQELDRSLE